VIPKPRPRLWHTRVASTPFSRCCDVSSGGHDRWLLGRRSPRRRCDAMVALVDLVWTSEEISPRERLHHSALLPQRPRSARDELLGHGRAGDRGRLTGYWRRYPAVEPGAEGVRQVRDRDSSSGSVRSFTAESESTKVTRGRLQGGQPRLRFDGSTGRRVFIRAWHSAARDLKCYGTSTRTPTFSC
jgi:hypothetical protein